jgi:glycosyltransferase involved in cell wall biosynthesis
LRQEHPDSLIASIGHANVVALCARVLAGASTRIVVTEHLNTSVSDKGRRPLPLRAVRRLAGILYGWADEVVAVSEGVADDMVRCRLVPSRKHIKVIYNAVVSPELHERAKAPVEHHWFAPGERPVLLTVGRLTAQKDHTTLLKAFASLRQRRSARLLILGEGEARPQLEDLIATLGLREDVNLPGFVENPYAYMSRSAGFVLSSAWEGLPTVLIEALALDVPVVSTDCPSGPREILKNGAFGALVPVGDAPALAAAMERMLEDRRGCCANASALQQSLWPFQQENAVEAYLEACFGPEATGKDGGFRRRKMSLATPQPREHAQQASFQGMSQLGGTATKKRSSPELHRFRREGV